MHRLSKPLASSVRVENQTPKPQSTGDWKYTREFEHASVYVDLESRAATKVGLFVFWISIALCGGASHSLRFSLRHQGGLVRRQVRVF
jgi:hypothetical protein